MSFRRVVVHPGIAKELIHQFLPAHVAFRIKISLENDVVYIR